MKKKLMASLAAVLEFQKYEFYRGDSFQVFLKSPEEALLLVLQLRSAAMKLTSETSMPLLDIRTSIGIGKVTLPVKTLKTASGEAFILSGRGFDQLKNEQRLLIQTEEKNKIANLGLKVLSEFIDYLFRRLTFKQSAVLYELLFKRTQVEAARRLKKSQATVNKHTQSAGWPEIEKLLVDYRNIINSIEP